MLSALLANKRVKNEPSELEKVESVFANSDIFERLDPSTLLDVCDTNKTLRTLALHPTVLAKVLKKNPEELPEQMGRRHDFLTKEVIRAAPERARPNLYKRLNPNIGEIYAVHWSNDNRKIIVGGVEPGDGRPRDRVCVKVLDIASERELVTLVSENQFLKRTFGDRARLTAAVHVDDSLHIFNPTGEAVQLPPEQHDALELSPAQDIFAQITASVRWQGVSVAQAPNHTGLTHWADGNRLHSGASKGIVNAEDYVSMEKSVQFGGRLRDADELIWKISAQTPVAIATHPQRISAAHVSPSKFGLATACYHTVNIFALVPRPRPKHTVLAAIQAALVAGFGTQDEAPTIQPADAHSLAVVQAVLDM